MYKKHLGKPQVGQQGHWHTDSNLKTRKHLPYCSLKRMESSSSRSTESPYLTPMSSTSDFSHSVVASLACAQMGADSSGGTRS